MSDEEGATGNQIDILNLTSILSRIKLESSSEELGDRKERDVMKEI